MALSSNPAFPAALQNINRADLITAKPLRHRSTELAVLGTAVDNDLSSRFPPIQETAQQLIPFLQVQTNRARYVTALVVVLGSRIDPKGVVSPTLNRFPRYFVRAMIRTLKRRAAWVKSSRKKSRNRGKEKDSYGLPKSSLHKQLTSLHFTRAYA
jgi:hypothetical protein